jgi:hypothetical protein
MRHAHAPAEIDAGDDVAPLIGAAHLQVGAVAARELRVVVGLQKHVVELDERQLLLAVEAQLDRVHRQHAVHRHVAADVAQEIDVVELGQPFGVVEHQRVGLAVAEGEELREHRLDLVLVVLNRLKGQDPAGLVTARRIADAGRATAHQGNRLAGAGLLQPVQHHDRKQMTDMERRGRAVVAGVGHDFAGARQFVDAGAIGALVDETALGQNVEEVGSEIRHDGVREPS